MFKCLLMLSICVMAQRIYGKSLFDYNVNPEYDLLAEPSTSYSNFWSGSEFYESPHYSHYIKRRGHGNSHGHGRGKVKHGLPLHSFDISPGYFYPDSSEELSEEIYHTQPAHPHHTHPRGLPPGQAKKQGYIPGPPHGHPPHGLPPGPPHGHPSHGLPPGQAKKQGYIPGPPHGHPHEPPRRFPPPPVYDKDFINPWATPAPFTVQQPPLTTPLAVYVAPKLTTPKPVYVAPKLTTPRTTPAPPESTTNDNGLIYDIDVRFGRD